MPDVAALWLATSLLCALPSQGAPSSTAKGPKLIVLVSVDQMIPEHLHRLEPWLTGGLRRFLEAEVWERAVHAHGISDTAPGHATLGSGVHPARHGVIANAWLAPETGGRAYCVGDPEARLIAPDGTHLPGGPSPRNLLVPGLADYVKRANSAAKAVSIAGKDRAAILSAGAEVDLALWWNRPTGGFATSSWYAESMPDWVLAWNAEWVQRSTTHTWTPLIEDLEGSGTAEDDRKGEPEGRTRFPHRAPGLDPNGETLALGRFVFGSPLIDRYTVELATQALDRYELGRDDVVDYLFLGLSACDTVGHSYGPYSREVTDVVLRVDRELEGFFRELDRKVGEGRWIAALTSDHGVLELPESLQHQGIPAQRHSLAGSRAAVAGLGQALAENFGAELLLGIGWRGLRLSHERMRTAELEPEAVERFAAELLSEVEIIERIFTRTELERWKESDRGADPLLDLMARSHHREQSWDLTFTFRPWKVFQTYGTSHGSPWHYDRKVPLAFLGPGHRPGRRFEPVFTVDVCPTLLARAGLPVPPDLDGRRLP